jgi:hypothetical protein
MKPSRLAFYIALAVSAIAVAFSLLAKEPSPDWPVNLIHLLFKH